MQDRHLPAGRHFGAWRLESDGRLWLVNYLQAMDLRNFETREHLWYVACLFSAQDARTLTG